jgi:predicted DNA-binding protein (UPF0251 family)
MRGRFRRRIHFNFNDRYYKPRGVPMRGLEEVVITHEEMEVLRLRYAERLKQEDAAKKMGISQSQYQRDLWEAHAKITDALMSGKAIHILDPK